MRTLVFALLLLTACVKPPPAAAPDSGVTKAAALTLDEAKLAKWVTYRANLREAHAKLRSADAGNADLQRAMIAALARQADARAAAARATGLSVSEVINLDGMIFQVMAQRSVAKNGEQAKLLAKLKARADNMNPDQRVDAIEDMRELEGVLKKMESGEGLAETLGKENVELINAHAEELMPLYEQALLDERTQ